MAQEFRGKGANVALAPGLGIARVPTGGRVFEYLCGEDPLFCSQMAIAAVTGLFPDVKNYDFSVNMDNELEILLDKP